MIRISFLINLITVIVLGCAEHEKPPYQLSGDAATLLTNDSLKTWKLARRYNNDTRMNMGDCFLAYRVSYSVDSTVKDNLSQNRGCGESLRASWKFAKSTTDNYYLRLESEQLPRIMNIDEDYKLLKILKLTEEELILQYYHKQFSDKQTTITDIYVPQNAPVSDRDFHW